ncbi:hypothetical protein ACWTU6_07500 [Mesorhizobium sp. BHbsci]
MGHRLREIPALRELAPGEWFKSVDVDEYRRCYLDQLARLDPGETVCRIEDLARGRSAALLCRERPRDADFSVTFLSPRLRLSAWLHDKVGLEIYEFGREGCGHQHPKLPEAHRWGLVQPRLI